MAAYQPFNYSSSSVFEQEGNFEAQTEEKSTKIENIRPPKQQQVQMQQLPQQIQQQLPQQLPQQYIYQNTVPEMVKQEPKQRYIKEENQSYIDKLLNKKKDLIKILLYTFIIVLALSIHYLIDYYLNQYISNNNFSMERLLFVKLLYPIVIIFIIWNLKIFIK